MTEIPMPETGSTSGTPASRPTEILALVLIVAVNAILGVVSAVIGLTGTGDAVSVVGFIVAVIALFVAKGLWDLNPQAWLWAVILGIVGIPLYYFSVLAFEGIFLCVFTLIFLNLPPIKQHYQ